MYWAKPVKDACAMGFERRLDVAIGRKARILRGNKVASV
jgi:hypothetical protein